jgi:hypothetical protein
VPTRAALLGDGLLVALDAEQPCQVAHRPAVRGMDAHVITSSFGFVALQYELGQWGGVITKCEIAVVGTHQMGVVVDGWDLIQILADVLKLPIGLRHGTSKSGSVGSKVLREGPCIQYTEFCLRWKPHQLSMAGYPIPSRDW